MCEIFSKLTTQAPEGQQWCRSSVFIVNFLHIVLVFSLLTLNKKIPAGTPGNMEAKWFKEKNYFLKLSLGCPKQMKGYCKITQYKPRTVQKKLLISTMMKFDIAGFKNSQHFFLFSMAFIKLPSCKWKLVSFTFQFNRVRQCQYFWRHYFKWSDSKLLGIHLESELN